jgi:single-strand DNA-binding protein
MSVNKYICVGRLTRDPELRSLPSGTTVCDMRIAVEGMGRGYETGYITVAAFGDGGAAAAEHLSKGWLVAVDGRLEFVEWETDSGEKRSEYTVVGNVEFLAAPRPAEEDSKPSRSRTQPVAA